MLRIVFIAILIYVLFRLVKNVFGSGAKIQKGGDGKVIDEMVQDPFCKIYIPRREGIRRLIKGREFIFCSRECADKFETELGKKDNGKTGERRAK